ncbi:hypothetical protein ERX27_01850 [Macrococcus brunensis]|uniref:DUF805 domain-containing protein n=1 Tax=Macrococcus brunensis TaxID=198483 RepID=A0A4R6BFG8_9STAP|nr:hypothetical protein [Macrococcus brunensis]TDL98540.1 hypothetical protein ERX27_01850 [Macrococcus brunensis]
MKNNITWKEAWQDYIRNFFKPKAPISYEMYDKHRWVSVPLLILLLILFFFISYQLDLFDSIDWNQSLEKYHKLKVEQAFLSGLVFTLFLFIFHLTDLTTELRMFHARGKSARDYLIALIVAPIISLLFVYLMYRFEQENQTFFIIIFFYLPSYFNNWRYINNRKADRLRKEY